MTHHKDNDQVLRQTRKLKAFALITFLRKRWVKTFLGCSSGNITSINNTQIRKANYGEIQVNKALMLQPRSHSTTLRKWLVTFCSCDPANIAGRTLGLLRDWPISQLARLSSQQPQRELNYGHKPQVWAQQDASRTSIQE